MKRIVRLTERDLSRIVKRVIKESSNDTESIVRAFKDVDPNLQIKIEECVRQELRQIYPKYKEVLNKIYDYNQLEWWEWYDRLTMAPTEEDYEMQTEYLSILGKKYRECFKKYVKQSESF